MKKSNILIAVFAVLIAAASAAQAAGVTVDFDGKDIGSMNFMEAIKTTEKNAGGAMATVSAPVKVDAPETKVEIDELNRSIGTAIKDCEKKELVGLKTKFEKLLMEGIPQEKRDFVYNSKQTYEFPRRLFTGIKEAKIDTAASLLNMTKNCVVWGTKQECVTNRKEVCHTTCAVATLVCLAVAGVTAPVCTWAAPACVIACAFVDDTVCKDVKYCTQYATWPGQLPQADPW